MFSYPTRGIAREFDKFRGVAELKEESEDPWVLGVGVGANRAM